MTCKTTPVIDHDHSKIIKMFSFPVLVSACKKVSSIHQLLFEIQQNLESMTYKATPVFDNAHPIIIKVTFSFPEFVSACQNTAPT